jgi:hypothetical protein
MGLIWSIYGIYMGHLLVYIGLACIPDRMSDGDQAGVMLKNG